MLWNAVILSLSVYTNYRAYILVHFHILRLVPPHLSSGFNEFTRTISRTRCYEMQIRLAEQGPMPKRPTLVQKFQ